MPGYTFTVGADQDAWNCLGRFTRGYIQALFHHACTVPYAVALEEPEATSNLPATVGFSDLSQASLKRIMQDCEAFQVANAEALSRAYLHRRFLEPNSPMQYCPSNAGRDFYGSRNGVEGIGYLEACLGETSEALHLAAWRKGNVFVRLTRGKVIVS